MDFFLWGYVKDLVYVDNSQIMDHLRTKIQAVIAEILSEICRKVIQNLFKRIEDDNRSRGEHFNDIVFMWNGKTQYLKWKYELISIWILLAICIKYTLLTCFNLHRRMFKLFCMHNHSFNYHQYSNFYFLLVISL